MSQTTAPARAQRYKLIIAVVVALAAIVAVVVAVLLLTGSDPVNAKGTLSFNCYPCSSSVNDDVTDRSQITVVDETNTVIGSGTLKLVRLDDPALAALALYNRTFTFEITRIEGGHDRYGFHVGDSNRAVMWVNADALSEEFQLNLK